MQEHSSVFPRSKSNGKILPWSAVAEAIKSTFQTKQEIDFSAFSAT